ncbi:MAG: 3'-5' exoribonuclease YhaM family protein [Bdellovibrionia bacterium]
MKKNQYVKDIKDKEAVSSSFLIKYSATALGKNGKPYMNLVFLDKTGEIEARLWEDVSQYVGQAVRDQFVWVEGRCQTYQGRKQVVIQKLQLLREDEVDVKEYVAASALDVDALYAELLAQVDSMQDPDYKALAEAVLKEDAEIMERMKKAPAARSIHHAYPGGLLEHVLSITQILDQLARHYGKALDRDLLFLGGFFHDIGKIWELSYDRLTEYTTEGQLIGHLVMGVEMVERKVRELEAQPGRLRGAFPLEKKLLVKHLILAHHGKLEYGSPKEPLCLEALVVHMVDDLDSKMNAIGKFMEKDQNPGRWTALNRNYERFFYKPDWILAKAMEQQGSSSS